MATFSIGNESTANKDDNAQLWRACSMYSWAHFGTGIKLLHLYSWQIPIRSIQKTRGPIFKHFHGMPWSPNFCNRDISIFIYSKHLNIVRHEPLTFRLSFGSHGIPWKRLKIGHLFFSPRLRFITLNMFSITTKLGLPCTYLCYFSIFKYFKIPCR